MSASRRRLSPIRHSPRRPASMSRAASAATARRMRSRACSTVTLPPPSRVQIFSGGSARPPAVSTGTWRTAARASSKGTAS